MIENKEYAQIGAEIIRDVLPHLADLDIAYLSSGREKKLQGGKVVYGECVKVNQTMYGWCCPYDFMIIIYDMNIAHLDESQLRILIEHELMHIGIDEESGDETRYYIVPHDVEEFNEIIRKYGLRWSDAKRS